MVVDVGVVIGVWFLVIVEGWFKLCLVVVFGRIVMIIVGVFRLVVIVLYSIDFV